VANGEISTLRSELRSGIASEVAQALEEEIACAVEEALLGAFPPFDLPPSLVEAQRENLRQAQEGGGGESEGQLEGEAVRLLRTTLAWAHAARQLGVHPDPTALWKETEALAAAARNPQEELDRVWEDASEIQEIEDRLLRRRVVEAVLAAARVEEESTSFRELARRRQQRIRESAKPETS
jgi:trigger factor